MSLGDFTRVYPRDIWQRIVGQCDLEGVMELSRTSCFCRKLVIDCISMMPFEAVMKICSSRIRVINTGEEKILPFNRFLLIQKCYETPCFVEDNKYDSPKLTFLVMREKLTLNELLKIAAEARIEVELPEYEEEFLEQVGNAFFLDKSYVALITNGVFEGSRGLRREEHEKLVEKLGYMLPTIQEYLAVSLFTQGLFRECLYGDYPKETWPRSRSFWERWNPYSHDEEYVQRLAIHSCGPLRLEISDEHGGESSAYFMGAGGVLYL